MEPKTFPNLIVQLESEAGEPLGPQLDVPHSVTPAQLETLLHGLLGKEDRLPYSFNIGDQKLNDELGAHVTAHKVVLRPSTDVRPGLLQATNDQSTLFAPEVLKIASLAGHSESILAISFSPNGQHLGSASGDTTVRLWDLPTQGPHRTCKGHRGWVLCLSWAPDGVALATGGMDGAIWLWDPSTGDAFGNCRGHTKWITSMSWEPAHLALPSRRFCSGSKDACIKVWDAASRRCLFSMSNHTKAISCVKWSGSSTIISSARDCSINVWSSEDGRLLRALKGHGHWVNTLALSTEHVLRTGAFDHTGSAPKDTQDAQQRALQRYSEATAGGHERLASGSDDFTMFLWEPQTKDKALHRMTGHQQLINQVAFSPNGRYIASASFDKSIKLWNGLTGSFIATLRAHVGAVYQISWSPDARLLVSSSKDSTLKVWNIGTRKVQIDLPGHADEVFAVDWSPNATAVASGGKDHVLRLWKP